MRLPFEIAAVQQQVSRLFPVVSDYRRIQEFRSEIARAENAQDRACAQAALILHFLSFGGATKHEVTSALRGVIANISLRSASFEFINELTIALSSAIGENLLGMIPEESCGLPELRPKTLPRISSHQFYEKINMALLSLAQCESLDGGIKIFTGVMLAVGFSSGSLFKTDPLARILSWGCATKGSRAESIYPLLFEYIADAKPFGCLDLSSLSARGVPPLPDIELGSFHYQFGQGSPRFFVLGLAQKGAFAPFKGELAANIEFLVQAIRRLLPK